MLLNVTDASTPMQALYFPVKVDINSRRVSHKIDVAVSVLLILLFVILKVGLELELFIELSLLYLSLVALSENLGCNMKQKERLRQAASIKICGQFIIN